MFIVQNWDMTSMAMAQITRGKTGRSKTETHLHRSIGSQAAPQNLTRWMSSLGQHGALPDLHLWGCHLHPFAMFLISKLVFGA